MLIEIMQFK